MSQGQTDPLLTFLLTQELIVFGMASDPEPKQPSFYFNRKSAIMKANSDGPVFANLLEVERRVRRVSLEQFIACISQVLNPLGESVITRPEVG